MCLLQPVDPSTAMECNALVDLANGLANTIGSKIAEVQMKKIEADKEINILKIRTGQKRKLDAWTPETPMSLAERYNASEIESWILPAQGGIPSSISGFDTETVSTWKGKGEGDLYDHIVRELQRLCSSAGQVYFVKNTSKTKYLGRKAPDISVFFDSKHEDLTSYVVTIGDVKTGKFDSGDRMQVLLYAERALLAQGERDWIVVFLMNSELVQFFKVEKTTSGFKNHQSSEMPFSQGTKGFAYLYELLSKPATSPPCPVFLDVPNLTIRRFIGKGASGRVFEVFSDTDVYALKVFASSDEMAKEVENLTLLKRKDVKGVPTLVAETFPYMLIQPFLNRSREKQTNSLLSLVDILQSFTWLALCTVTSALRMSFSPSQRFCWLTGIVLLGKMTKLIIREPRDLLLLASWKLWRERKASRSSLQTTCTPLFAVLMPW